MYTQKSLKPILSRTNPGGFDYKDYLNKSKYMINFMSVIQILF